MWFVYNPAEWAHLVAGYLGCVVLNWACLCLAFVPQRTSPEPLRPFVVDRAEVPEQVRELRGNPIRLWNEPQTQAPPLAHSSSNPLDVLVSEDSVTSRTPVRNK